jgi:hypothetical protein
MSVKPGAYNTTQSTSADAMREVHRGMPLYSEISERECNMNITYINTIIVEDYNTLRESVGWRVFRSKLAEKSLA